MNAEQKNEGQKSALEMLREKIEKQKFERSPVEVMSNILLEKEHSHSTYPFEVIEVPYVIEPLEGAEFSLERYEQLARKVDVLYHNYLVSKEEYIKSSDSMAEALKGLAQGMNDIISEGVKPRF